MLETYSKNLKLGRRLSRVFLWILAMIIALFLLVFSIFQIPKVQTKLLNKISFLLSENTGFDVSFGHANLTWYDHVILSDIRLYDQKNDSTLISIKDVKIDFKLYDILFKRQLNADQLILEQPYVHIIKSNDSTSVNISRFIYDLKNLFKNQKKKKFSLFVDKIEIRNGHFSHNDLHHSPIKEGKDYYHFSFDNINAKVSTLSFIKDSLAMKIRELKSTDPENQLNINQFKGDFSFTKKRMIISNYSLLTDKSLLNDSLVFSYESPSNFNHFTDSITFYADFSSAKIDSNELSLFNKKIKDINKILSFSGTISGSVKRLKVSNFDIRTGSNTQIRGSAEFFGLPNIKETFISTNISSSTMEPSDITNLYSEKYLQDALRIGKMSFRGRFIGFLTDFVTNGEFNSSAGFVKTDINFKIRKDNKAWYTGVLKLVEFDLRSLFENQTEIKQVSLEGKINGHGLRIDSANFDLNAHIDSLKVLEYNYSNISINGHFGQQFFNGNLKIQDPNLSFNGQVKIDLRNNINRFNVQAKLDTANLKPLGLSKHDINIKSSLDINMKDFRTGDMIGYVSLFDNKISYDSKELRIDSLKLLSSLIGKNRIIHLETDGLSGEMKGEFNNSVFLKTIAQFYREIKLNIENDDTKINTYYTNKSKEKLTKFNLKISLNLWNLNKFIQPFYPDFFMSENVRFDCSFKQDSISSLSLYSQFDSLYVKDTKFINNKIDINISKDYFAKSILASSSIQSKHQTWLKKHQTENINSEVIWHEDSMNIDLNIEQEKFKNQIKLSSSIVFSHENTKIRFNPSIIKILGDDWMWKESNEITFANREWQFNNLKLYKDDEYVEVSGSYSEVSKKAVYIDIKEFSIENLQSIIPVKLEGTIDGRIKIKKRAEDNLIEGNVVTRAFKIEDFLVGNIFGASTWNNSDKSFAVNFDLVRNGKKRIDVDGLIYPQKIGNQLELRTTFDSADLKIAEPFLNNLFSDIQGFASGQFDISGRMDRPVLTGNGHVNQGHLKVNYLNTTYDFFGNIIFAENEIGFDNLSISDSEKNKATLNGGIFHDGFENSVLDIQGEFENFKLLNTTAASDNAYFGTAYGTGEIEFLGAINDIHISANAQTSKGTRLSIPLGGLSDYNIDQKEYIEFVNLSNEKTIDKMVAPQLNSKLNTKGIELNFNIEFTPDAYVELIFDYQAGDIIRGRGNGNIELQINTDGDFNMFGDYEIEKGGYNFTLYNIINKEFTIKNGSTISWHGDPYGAQLNILAKYRQLASLAPILSYLDAENLKSPEVRKKYPSIVDLNLSGILLEPEIKFGIIIEDYPQSIQLLGGSTIPLESMVSAFDAKLASNEQEMNRQVFSLIILRKFSPENSFQVNTQTIGNSLSEFLSNQLSYWATQVDENLEIDVDLTGLNKDAFNTFQFRLSYTFLDGRLRISRGGGIPAQNNNDNTSAIIGDWTVEYLLTEDGRFRVKMYNRSDLNAIEESNIETGFSLQYIKSFDTLKQMLTDNRKKNISKKNKAI